MRIETRTTALLLALVVLAAFAIPTTLADSKDKIVNITEGYGKINSTVMHNVSTFAFEANNIFKVEGNLQYNDHGAMIKLYGNVTMLMVDKTVTPHMATFSGWAKVTNDTGAKMTLPYKVMVKEGKKGVGTFSISLPTAAPPFLPLGYSDSDTLLGGLIEVESINFWRV
jgi:hypothetical protein